MPAGPIYKVDEVFADPQVQHLGIAVPLKDSERGDVHVVGQPIVMSRTPASVVSGVPEQGEHTQDILQVNSAIPTPRSRVCATTRSI